MVAGFGDGRAPVLGGVAPVDLEDGDVGGGQQGRDGCGDGVDHGVVFAEPAAGVRDDEQGQVVGHGEGGECGQGVAEAVVLHDDDPEFPGEGVGADDADGFFFAGDGVDQGQVAVGLGGEDAVDDRGDGRGGDVGDAVGGQAHDRVHHFGVAVLGDGGSHGWSGSLGVWCGQGLDDASQAFSEVIDVAGVRDPDGVGTTVGVERGPRNDGDALFIEES